MTEIALAMGGNLGNTAEIMIRAMEMLTSGGVKINKISSIIITVPVDCPPETPNFVNGALIGEWSGTPFALLELCQETERKLGRKENHGVNTSRTIDLDIITFGDLEMESPRLSIPHPRAASRRFVLEPLAEIAPEWKIGTSSVKELLDSMK